MKNHRSELDAIVELEPDQAALVAYGSLLSAQKMRRMLGRTPVPQPQIAELSGWRRFWNGLMPNSRGVSGLTTTGRPTPEKLLYLNLCPASSPVPVNVLVWIIPSAALSIFDEDEQTYERVRVNDDLRGIQILGGEVYAYTARPEWVLTEPGQADTVAVLQSYVNELEAGLQSLGPEFEERFWMSSETVPRGLVLDDLE